MSHKIAVGVNPFIYPRREFDEEHTIFLADMRDYLEWISTQQCLFEGIRGSGKTSILKSMQWDVAWKHSKIKVEGSGRIRNMFTKPQQHLAVCYRVDEMDVRYWDSWKQRVGCEWAQKYFGSYIEYVLLDLFLTAIITIMDIEPGAFENRDSEKQLVENLIQMAFPGDSTNRPRLVEKSLRELRSIIRDNHSGIRDLAFRGASPDSLSKSYHVLSPGELVRCFAENLINSYQRFASFRIFPMLDDCNNLKVWQAQVINTAIARARTPVSYKITAVQRLYASLMTIDGRPLTGQELKRISISAISEGKWEQHERFVNLIQGVCQSRIETSYDRDLADKFNFKKFLGDFNLEDAINISLSRSEKSEAIEILAKAKEKSRETGKSVSITSIWLAQLRRKMKRLHTRKINGVSLDTPEIRKKLIRQLDSKYFKKYKYSAAIAICQDLHLTFQYYGWSTVIHLCCGSVREMLHIMSEIWSEMDMPIEQFVDCKNISKEKQSKAIRNAAKGHFETLDKKPIFEIKGQISTSGQVDYSPTSLPSICKRLGDLFARLQSYPSVCVDAETASIGIQKDGRLTGDIEGAVKVSVMSGMLLKDDNETQLKVGLHPFFSPLFNISFRYPFYSTCYIGTDDFIMLLRGSDRQAQEAANRIVNMRNADYVPTKTDVSKQQDFFNSMSRDI